MRTKSKIRNLFLHILLGRVCNGKYSGGIDDKGKRLKRILDERINCAISFIPETLRRGCFTDKELDLLERIKNGPGILGQRGNNYECMFKHRFVDSGHENYCLYNRELSYNEQLNLMFEGMETLIKYLEKPLLYRPPNHQYDMTTIEVASPHYLYFAERGITNTEPYLFRNMTFLPEVELGKLSKKGLSKKGGVYCVHYDEIDRNQKAFDEVAEKACAFSSKNFDLKIPIRELKEEIDDFRIGFPEGKGRALLSRKDLKVDKKARKNHQAVLRRKKLRDLLNLLKLPKNIFRK